MTTGVNRKLLELCKGYDNFLRIEAGSSHGRAVFLVNGKEESTTIPYGRKVSDCSYRNVKSRIKGTAMGRPTCIRRTNSHVSAT